MHSSLPHTVALKLSIRHSAVELLPITYAQNTPLNHYVIPKLLFSGGMSGIVSWLSTYPVDVIKSRLQADGVGGITQYNGILDCIRKSYHDEGWRVFTRGLTSTLLRAFPVNAATFATVTVFLMYMRSEEDLRECEPGPKRKGKGHHFSN
uniref:Uncharacterized protein n=1 Tax=Apteryx owenii TaxID=8824 RepID=A0A8B9SAZ8_APTOW